MFRLLVVFATLAVSTVSAFISPSVVARARQGLQLRMVVEPRNDLRNVAIIAHVDHGKTTLVDSMIKQSGAFRANQELESMDNNDQERERGITILAKNAAIMYEGKKINLVDTPGHADFGGEVERIMNMVDGVLLVVDSVDGPKPQTRFVTKKALEKGIKAILVVNKIDRPQARPSYVVDKVFDLFAELGATDEQMDFQIVYASGMNGIAGDEPDKLKDNLEDVFKKILNLPPAQVDKEHPLQMLIANVDYDDFKGKLGIGRLVLFLPIYFPLLSVSLFDVSFFIFPVSIVLSLSLLRASFPIFNSSIDFFSSFSSLFCDRITNGVITAGEEVSFGKPGEPIKKGKIAELFVFNNVGREKVDTAYAGDIVMMTGIADITIGDTVMSKDDPVPMPPIRVEEPTVRMSIGVNKSPLAGREGKLLQSRVIRDRLYKVPKLMILLLCCFLSLSFCHCHCDCYGVVRIKHILSMILNDVVVPQILPFCFSYVFFASILFVELTGIGS